MKWEQWIWNRKSETNWIKDHHSPVVFKHGSSLEIYLALWRKKAIPGPLYFSKKFQENYDMGLGFKKRLQVFLLNGNFGDTEFYYFSVDQSWYNGI